MLVLRRDFRGCTLDQKGRGVVSTAARVMAVAYMIVSRRFLGGRRLYQKDREFVLTVASRHGGGLHTGLGVFQARLVKKAMGPPLSTTRKPQILYTGHSRHTSSQL